MYGFDYDSSGSEHSRASPMLFNVKVYQVGDVYGVQKLKYHAKKKFEDIIKSCWQANDFHTTVTEVYSSTPAKDRGLRDPLVTTSLEHIETLKRNDDFVQVLQDTPGFAGDLILYSSSSGDSKPTYRCPNCYQQWQFGITGSPYYYYCPFVHTRRGIGANTLFESEVLCLDISFFLTWNVMDKRKVL